MGTTHSLSITTTDPVTRAIVSRMMAKLVEEVASKEVSYSMDSKDSSEFMRHPEFEKHPDSRRMKIREEPDPDDFIAVAKAVIIDVEDVDEVSEESLQGSNLYIKGEKSARFLNRWSPGYYYLVWADDVEDEIHINKSSFINGPIWKRTIVNTPKEKSDPTSIGHIAIFKAAIVDLEADRDPVNETNLVFSGSYTVRGDIYTANAIRIDRSGVDYRVVRDEFKRETYVTRTDDGVPAWSNAIPDGPPESAKEKFVPTPGAPVDKARQIVCELLNDYLEKNYDPREFQFEMLNEWPDGWRVMLSLADRPGTRYVATRSDRKDEVVIEMYNIDAKQTLHGGGDL